MSGIIGGAPGRRIAPLTQRKKCGIPGIGHPGAAIPSLLSRKEEISEKEFKAKNDLRHLNRERRVKAKSKK